MPLPLALVAVPAVLGLVGLKKGYDAYSSRAEAQDLETTAHDTLSKALRALREARSRCAAALGRLGELKVDVWNRQLGRFVFLFGELRNVDLRGAARIDRIGEVEFTTEDLAEIKASTEFCREVAAGGALAIGSGALVGLASFGGATMYATASTGAAISSLSGAAFTNATLAWFGGGALTAGGAGIAGGVAVLGGIVAAPVLAVGGLVLAATARKGLASARIRNARLRKTAAAAASATSVVNQIHAGANQARAMITDLDKRFGAVLDELSLVMATNGLDYAQYSDSDKRAVHVALLFAQGLKIFLDTPILTKDGLLEKERLDQAIEQVRKLLDLMT